MNNLLAWLLFKLISFAVQSLLVLESLLNDFLRYIYIPLIMAGSSPKKIIRSLSALPKKPTDEVTMVVDARANKTTDLARTAINIMRYCRMVEEGISPKSLVCLVSTHNLTQQQRQKLQEILTQLKPQQSILQLQYEEQTFATQRLKVQKSKLTPLVISFCSYPSIVCLPPSLLIGAQISFNPPILKSTDYDILSSFQRYSNSEQRKGK